MSDTLDLLFDDIAKISASIRNKEGDEIPLLNKRVELINIALQEISKDFDVIFKGTDWAISGSPTFSVYCYSLPDTLWTKFNTLSSIENQKSGGTIQFNVDAISVTISCNKQGNYVSLNANQGTDALDNLKAISKFLFKHRSIFIDTTLLRKWIHEQDLLTSLANNLISPSFKCKEIQ